nr:hypothetical protein [Tanacetum cinerariifolium]
MEQVHGTHKASKLEPGDIISNMPENVITNILDHLPLKDAVKTDILSKFWRFKYTMLTHLVFDEIFYDDLPDKYKRKMVKIISRLLLHFKGPITRFVLYIPCENDDDSLDVEDVDHWVLFLSRNGIKDLTLICSYDGPLELPTQLYSCRELKHLKLYNFCFHPSPSFHVFPNLLTLHLISATFENYTFGEFIVQCPFLEILSNLDDEYCSTGEVELVEISKAKLGNLKVLSWSLGSSDMPTTMIKSSSIFQLAIHPKLQELDLRFWSCKFVTEPGLNKKVPTAFLCLKTLKLYPVDFTCDFGSFVLEMICNSPNLQSLKIMAIHKDNVPTAHRFIDLDYSTMEQLQLRSVVFKCFKGSENEMSFIKYLLACSPLLKRVVIVLE